MDTETSITPSIHTDDASFSAKQEATFHASWQGTDNTFLQPNNLAIPKIRRAWDRKPLTPFSRQRLRVGKVWKRAAALRAGMNIYTTKDEDRAAKRRKPIGTSSSPSRLKPVKKMCMDSNFGMGARVLQWEGGESPVRKIVTRSNHATTDQPAVLLELDEEGKDEAGDVTVEILDEEGRVVDTGGQGLERKEQEWEDESGEEVGDEDSYCESASEDGSRDQDASGEEVLNPVDYQTEVPARTEQTPEYDETGTESGSTGEEPAEANESAAPLHISPGFVLPEGFVSPIKQSRPLGPKAARQSFTSRRKTLPVQFAPVVPADAPPTVPINYATSHEQRALPGVDDHPTGIDLEIVDAESDRTSQDTGDDGETGLEEEEWEDVKDDAPAQELLDYQEAADDLSVTDVATDGLPDVAMEDFGESKTLEHKAETAFLDLDAQEDYLQPGSGTKLPSSPVPSIEGQHPRLPLRRSPRRKSSSPLKQSTVTP